MENLKNKSPTFNVQRNWIAIKILVVSLDRRSTSQGRQMSKSKTEILHDDMTNFLCDDIAAQGKAVVIVYGKGAALKICPRSYIMTAP